MSAAPENGRPGGASSPLSGKRVVNPRSPDQAAELDNLLRERGAVPLPYPCIDIAPPLSPAALDEALARWVGGRFDWVVFTSVNAVRAIAGRAVAGGATALEGTSARIAAVGPGTAEAVRSLLHVSVALEPPVYTGDSLAEELVARGPVRVLLPLGDRARDILPRALVAGGAEVAVVTAYRTVLGEGGVDLPAMLGRHEVDAVLFTSPSTVDNLSVRLEKEHGDWSSLRAVCIGCIGPVTSQSARARGLEVQVQPSQHTLPALVGALESYFAGKGEGRRS